MKLASIKIFLQNIFHYYSTWVSEREREHNLISYVMNDTYKTIDVML